MPDDMPMALDAAGGAYAHDFQLAEEGVAPPVSLGGDAIGLTAAAPTDEIMALTEAAMENTPLAPLGLLDPLSLLIEPQQPFTAAVASPSVQPGTASKPTSASGKFTLRSKHPLSIRSSLGGPSSASLPSPSTTTAATGSTQQSVPSGSDQAAPLGTEPEVKQEEVKQEENADASFDVVAPPPVAALPGVAQLTMFTAGPEYDDDYD